MRQGVGKALMDHAKLQVSAEGGSKLVIQGDPNAEKFYEAVGGKLARERESSSIPGRYLPVFELTNT